jgi:hypothetical protein
MSTRYLATEPSMDVRLPTQYANRYTGNVVYRYWRMSKLAGRAACIVRDRVRGGEPGGYFRVAEVRRDAVLLAEGNAATCELLAECGFYAAADLGDGWYRWSATVRPVPEAVAVAQLVPAAEGPDTSSVPVVEVDVASGEPPEHAAATADEEQQTVVPVAAPLPRKVRKIRA